MVQGQLAGGRDKKENEDTRYGAAQPCPRDQNIDDNIPRTRKINVDAYWFDFEDEQKQNVKWKSRKEISLCEVETVEAQERLETVERERSRGLMRNI